MLPRADRRDSDTDSHSQIASALIPLLVTVKQAAELLGIGRTTVYELIEAGELRSVKRGSSRRIPLKAIHDYIDCLLEGSEHGGDQGGAVPSDS